MIGDAVTNDWDLSADAFEAFLDASDRIAGGIDADLPELPDLALTGTPDEETARRLRDLLARAEVAQAMLAERKAETAEELRRIDTLRHVGQRYLAF